MSVTREDWRREAWAWLTSLRWWNAARRAGVDRPAERQHCAEVALRCRARARGTR